MPLHLEALLKPDKLKWYFDYGTETLDQFYEPLQQKADVVMSDRGYRQGENWLTLKFEGAAHTEADWKTRLHRPLEFLFGVE